MIYKKDTSVAIQKIISTDKDARWMALDSFILPNYVLMIGGKVINSTNIYPNLELWEKVDQKKKYEDIYNRYAHITVSLTTNETNFELTNGDSFTLYLNYNDIKKLKVDYFICNHKLEIMEEYSDNFKLVYNSENVYIYKYKE